MRETASIAPRPRTQCEPLRPARSRPPASDAVSGHGVRRIARDGSLQQPCFAVRSRASELRVRAWVTGSAGGANNRRRREGDSGQNAEPTPSARTKPGPSAMAVNNRCRRRVLPRRASLFAEPVLTVGHAGARTCATYLRSRSGKRRLLPRTSSMMGCCWDSLNRRQDSCWSRLCGRNHIAVRTDADAIEEI